MAERLKAADCKSVETFLRRFKSYFSHNFVTLFGGKKKEAFVFIAFDFFK